MTVKLKINGPIVDNSDKWIYDLFDIEATCPNDIINALPENREDVEISINSYGGLVDQGNEIYTALKHYEGPLTVDVIMAGSAASIIAMSGSPTRISPVGQIMIHNVSAGQYGDYHEMDKMSDILQKSNRSLAAAYTLKTGLSEEEILKKMDEESWLTAAEAKELGFADEVLFENEKRPQLVANAGPGLIPKQVIDKMNGSPSDVMDIDSKLEKLIDQKLNKLTEKPKAENKSGFERFLF